MVQTYGSIELETVRDIDLKPKPVDQGQFKVCHGHFQKKISSTCEHSPGVKVGIKNQQFLQNGSANANETQYTISIV